MPSHPLEQLIQAADVAITGGDFDALMAFYANDAALVVKPGLSVRGKDNIRQAFVKIAAYFRHTLVVKQGRMEVIEGADSALVIMETLLEYRNEAGEPIHLTRRATYVFRCEVGGKWLCVIDNSYGTDLLDIAEAP